MRAPDRFRTPCLILLVAVCSAVVSSCTIEEAPGPSSDVYPLTLTVSFSEAEYTPGDRIAVALYDTAGKIGTTETILVTGQRSFFALYWEMNRVPADEVYILAFLDDDLDYRIDSGEPYIIYDSVLHGGAPTAVDLTTGTAAVTISFDGSNLWP